MTRRSSPVFPDQEKLNNNRNNNHRRVEATFNRFKGREGGKSLLYDISDVPAGLQESFVQTGYRKPYSTTWGCLQSLFYINNETFNIWSHIVTLLYFVVRYSVVLIELRQPSSPKRDFYYPMLSSAIGTFTVYALSVTAHLFNSKSEKMHRIFYFFDYAGISIYTYTSGQVMYFYNRPIHTDWRIFESALVYTTLGAILSFLATFYSCKSKVDLRKYGAIMRIIPVFAGWLNTVLSLSVGVTMCSCHAVTTCQSFIACNELLITYFRRHCFCSIVGGLIYGSRLPERLLPGTFDIIGNSHHFLHIFAALSTEYAFKILEVALESRQDPRNEMLAKSLSGISSMETLFPTIVVFVVNISIAFWFAKSIYNSKDSKGE
ncbi:hypothetical protein OS493_006492 [Desmophyllum pertusum]|uniref:Uncharacterized protein n=1 Tax=Desmophyllum pertusum TaxID=174260 RepID=A0A9X0DCA2_9CNID|nr:hypothetical protein OS493_006492 [Desmophyllum pertusum]